MNNLKELAYYTIAFLQITEQQVVLCFVIFLFSFLYTSSVMDLVRQKIQEIHKHALWS